MEKKATDWGEVTRYGLGGFASAVPATIAFKLMHEINADRQRRKMLQAPTDTEENTIVLRIPQKVAEIVGIPSAPSKTGPKSSATKQTRKGIGMAGHYPGGTTMKVGVQIVKEADPNTWAMRTLGLGLGAGAGYALVNKLYRMHAMRKLKDEEEQARQDMMNSLTPKTAFTLPDWAHPDYTKMTQPTSNHLADKIFGPLVLTGVLSTAGAAYLTKRILDAKTKENQGAGLEVPKVRRIVFQSVPAKQAPVVAPDEKMASGEDALFIKVSIDCYKDLLGGSSRLLSDAGLRKMLKDAGCDLDTLEKTAGHYEFLDKVAHPVVQRIQEAMERSPELIQKLAQGLTAPQPVAPSNPSSTGVDDEATLTSLGQNSAYAADLKKLQNDPEMLQRLALKNMPPSLQRTLLEHHGMFGASVQKVIDDQRDNAFMPEAQKRIYARTHGTSQPAASAPGAATPAQTATPPATSGLNPGILGAGAGLLAGAMLPMGRDDDEDPADNDFQKKLESSTPELAMKRPGAKQAQELDMGLLEKGLGEAPAPNMGMTATPTMAEIKDRPKHVEIEAADPSAKKYMVKVSPRLKTVLQELAEEGKL